MHYAFTLTGESPLLLVELGLRPPSLDLRPANFEVRLRNEQFEHVCKESQDAQLQFRLAAQQSHTSC